MPADVRRAQSTPHAARRDAALSPARERSARPRPSCLPQRAPRAAPRSLDASCARARLWGGGCRHARNSVRRARLRRRRVRSCFAPDPTPLARTYDFITCTEVAEHFHEPRRELAKIARLLRPGSWLALTTAIVNDETDLATWWYARDATHVSFYRRETLVWIAEHFGWELADQSATGALFVSP